MKIKHAAIYLSICLLTVSNSGIAKLTTLNHSQSNDPTGNLYISKSVGDISNCGPIAALMARKFASRNFSITNLSTSITKARYTVKPTFNASQDGIVLPDSNMDTSWWRIDDIQNYLRKNRVRHSNLNINHGEQAFIREVNKGNIMIVNLNMNNLPRRFGSVGKPCFTFPIPVLRIGNY